MAPAGKSKPEVQGSASAPISPALSESTIAKDGDLAPVLPSTLDGTNEWGRTLIWCSSAEGRRLAKSAYPFFLHSVFSGLVPPFSAFFTAVLEHYGIQALHLQPNSILLLSVFAFYCEAFMGVKPEVALFRHFFSLRLHDGAQRSACISFIVVQSGNMLFKAGKKVENFRHCWVFLDVQGLNARLELSKGLPEKTPAWGSAKLTDRRAKAVLE